jgi:hypothetical protein
MSARKAKRQPKAPQQPEPTPRMGATLEQVGDRVHALRGRIFDIVSLLKVCGSVLSLDNQDDGSTADDVGCSLKIAASNLETLPERLEMLTWTEDEIRRYEEAYTRKGGAA